MFKRTIILLILSLACANGMKAQVMCEEILSPVEKYIARGDVEKLSQWFGEALEVTIFSHCNDSSTNQARQILQTFFSLYTPRSFTISHVVDRPNIEYVLGMLNAGGENFIVTLFISKQEDRCCIQQFKIDRKSGRTIR